MDSERPRIISRVLFWAAIFASVFGASYLGADCAHRPACRSAALLSRLPPAEKETGR